MFFHCLAHHNRLPLHRVPEKFALVVFAQALDADGVNTHTSFSKLLYSDYRITSSSSPTASFSVLSSLYVFAQALDADGVHTVC